MHSLKEIHWLIKITKLQPPAAIPAGAATASITEHTLAHTVLSAGTLTTPLETMAHPIKN